MTSRIPLAFALLALSAGQGAAQSPAFSVTGSAPQVCAVAQPSFATGALNNFRALDGGSLQVDQLVDPRTLTTNGASAEVTFSAICTVPHRIVLQSRGNGLWRSQPGTGQAVGFGDAVPYSAELSWGNVRQRFEATGQSRGSAQVSTPVADATLGELKIALSILAGASNRAANSPLLAGVYSDTLTVTLEPQ